MIAGENVAFVKYPLIIKKDNVTFKFDNHLINISPWQKFKDFASIYINSLGTLPANSLLQYTAQVQIIEKNDAIRLDFETKGINKKSGEQKVIISAVLIDSSYSNHHRLLYTRPY